MTEGKKNGSKYLNGHLEGKNEGGLRASRDSRRAFCMSFQLALTSITNLLKKTEVSEKKSLLAK